MAKIEKSELTSEMIAAAMQCKTADELLELAKSGGYEITKAEAEAYLAELADVELDDKQSWPITIWTGKSCRLLPVAPVLMMLSGRNG